MCLNFFCSIKELKKKSTLFYLALSLEKKHFAQNYFLFLKFLLLNLKYLGACFHVIIFDCLDLSYVIHYQKILFQLLILKFYFQSLMVSTIINHNIYDYRDFHKILSSGAIRQH